VNVITNENYIKEQFRNARRLQILGIAALVIAFLISCPITVGVNLPVPVILVAYPFLIAGFPLLTMGNSRLRRLRSIPRADLLLNNELKGLNNKYSLYHYVSVDGKIFKHLLVAPGGLLVIESRDVTGPITCTSGPKGDRWKARTGLLAQFSGSGPQLGNPSQDLADGLERAKALLASINKPSVVARGLVVFTREEDLEIESCSYPGVPLSETKATVRQILTNIESSHGESTSGVATLLTSEDRRRLNALLAPEKPAAPAKPAAAARPRTGTRP
jgi:hypothetical protein